MTPAAGTDTIEAHLAAMGYTLPPPFVFPKNNRTGCTQAGSILYLSGHGLDLPKLPGVRQTGKFGVDITVDEGYATARAVALTMLATIKAHCGSLDHVKRVLRLFGMVNCTPEFEKHPSVINGCSELFAEIWGTDNGVGVRSAVGMGSLPDDIPVEIEAIFELA